MQSLNGRQPAIVCKQLNNLESVICGDMGTEDLLALQSFPTLLQVVIKLIAACNGIHHDVNFDSEFFNVVLNDDVSKMNNVVRMSFYKPSLNVTSTLVFYFRLTPY